MEEPHPLDVIIKAPADRLAKFLFKLCVPLMWPLPPPLLPAAAMLRME